MEHFWSSSSKSKNKQLIGPYKMDLDRLEHSLHFRKEKNQKSTVDKKFHASSHHEGWLEDNGSRKIMDTEIMV